MANQLCRVWVYYSLLKRHLATPIILLLVILFTILAISYYNHSCHNQQGPASYTALRNVYQGQ